MYKRAITVVALTGIPIVMATGQIASASSSPRAGQRSAGVSHAPSPARTRPAGPLRAAAFQPRFAAPAVSSPTVPHYSGKFSHAGKTYTYTSVGTNPKTSAAATTVPVTFIPVKIVDASGSFTYPTRAIKWTTGSALFHNSWKTRGTQYGDATLRNSYWSYVEAHGAKWHVRLGSPATTAPRTVKVPSNQGSDSLDSNGDLVMIINDNWYASTLARIAAKYSAKHLVVFLTYDTVGCSNFTKVSTCSTGGFHSAATSSTGTHTLAWASWMEPGVFGAKSADTAAISREIAEWLNDPFVNDVVPRWSVRSEPQFGCSKSFEVGDPLVGHVFTIGRWHFQDEANFSWFARQSPSIGFKGRYSDRGTLKTFSSSC